ncbi:DoxX [Actinomadura rubteroloni]|uniref:DoxX n=1 Tax=Actinomadura rubteroloni TaxID=1926885 RepID=A0A2P4UI90_9ACTN|nr:DoxX family protein [Actinomadura rubteroloni]POM24763.1 DoxX [Actinomadura rubteroloni]
MRPISTPITLLARPLVAAPYLVAGLETLRKPQQRAEQAGPALKNLADRFDWMPTKDPVTLVRIEGALSLGTGALLLAGRFRRLTSLLLAAQLVPAIATEHRYWTEDDPERRVSERSHLLKNAGLFGALLMVAAAPGTRAEKLKHQVKQAKTQAVAETRVRRAQSAADLRHAQRELARQVRDARRAAGKAGGRKAAKAVKATQKANWKAARKSGKASGAVKPVGKVLSLAGR